MSWYDAEEDISWLSLERNLVLPLKLNEVLFANIPSNKCKIRFGPLVSYAISVWGTVEKACGILSNWNPYSPIFNNHKLLIGKNPIYFGQCRHWYDKGIHSLGDIMDDKGLLSFEELCSQFNLQSSTFFFYLQLRAAMKTYGVPWSASLKDHPLLRVLCCSLGKRGLVSKLYGFFLDKVFPPLALDASWRTDIPNLSPDFEWDHVWSMVSQASKNPDHQQIHFNFIHRTYMTPRRLYCMKLKPDPYCTFCNTGELGTFFHMIWECPGVSNFWNMVSENLSTLLDISVPSSPSVLILNDLSDIPHKIQKRVFLAGLTAAKKLVATRWKPPHSLNKRHWVLTFMDVVYMELSTARIHGAREDTISFWAQILEKLKNMLS
ncbi:LINE-1 retrotransposable element ORF2 protein [Labeo rohita]|uniref:LINE-1 retrotransposable element ORF2 protein n=1 Tax=Labeo rohita TaxID=84645 RepID=A0ABQ8MAW6_LABRO|nr:LINE-1 retrotransposable element ORF2 protein [Labeo rohita]